MERLSQRQTWLDRKDVHVYITRWLTLASTEGAFQGLVLYQSLCSDLWQLYGPPTPADGKQNLNSQGPWRYYFFLCFLQWITVTEYLHCCATILSVKRIPYNSAYIICGQQWGWLGSSHVGWREKKKMEQCEINLICMKKRPRWLRQA